MQIPPLILLWQTGRKTSTITNNPIQHELEWYDRHSPFIPSGRANAESEMLALSPGILTTVLNLAGLWGGARSMRNWVGKVAPSKEVLQNKVCKNFALDFLAYEYSCANFNREACI
jgi:hypothetical protein